MENAEERRIEHPLDALAQRFAHETACLRIGHFSIFRLLGAYAYSQARSATFKEFENYGQYVFLGSGLSSEF